MVRHMIAPEILVECHVREAEAPPRGWRTTDSFSSGGPNSKWIQLDRFDKGADQRSKFRGRLTPRVRPADPEISPPRRGNQVDCGA